MPDPTPPATPPAVTPPAVTPPAAPPASALSSTVEPLDKSIPERLQVKTADGKIDIEASLRKVNEAYNALDKRMKDTGAPPDDPEKYEIEAPQGVDLTEMRKDPEFAGFLKSAHAQGMTNKQVSFVINKYLEVAPGLAEAAQEMSAEETLNQLKLTWKTDAELTGNITASRNAATRLAQSMGIEFKDIEAAGLGNNPMFIRLMASLAKMMGEDTPANGAGTPPTGDWEAVNKQLRAELEAIPENKPKERRAALEKITQHYQKRYPSRPAPALVA